MGSIAATRCSSTADSAPKDDTTAVLPGEFARQRKFQNAMRVAALGPFLQASPDSARQPLHRASARACRPARGVDDGDVDSQPALFRRSDRGPVAKPQPAGAPGAPSARAPRARSFEPRPSIPVRSSPPDIRAGAAPGPAPRRRSRRSEASRPGAQWPGHGNRRAAARPRH